MGYRFCSLISKVLIDEFSPKSKVKIRQKAKRKIAKKLKVIENLVWSALVVNVNKLQVS